MNAISYKISNWSGDIQETISPAKRDARHLDVVSLFSGCGGLDLGFSGGFDFLGTHYEKHPFQVTFANDINDAAVRSYNRNHDHQAIAGDIREQLVDLPATADIVIAGFPCQDVSVNGKGAGLSGQKTSLYRVVIEAIERLRPKVFVLENVKGFLNKVHFDEFCQVLAEFAALGYEVEYKLYNAADYGVPQTRERLFIVGRAAGMPRFEPPAPTHSKSTWVTAADALQDLEDKEWDVASSHIWSAAKMSKGQGGRSLKADRPGFTMRAECHGNQHWHYKLPRRISMREVARLQSFPDNYIFNAKLRETERQLGNAVPPVLAWHIAKAVKTLFAA